MAYLFYTAPETEAMYATPNRDPTMLNWYADMLAHERDGPIEDWMRPHYPDELIVAQGTIKPWGRTFAQFCISREVKNIIETLEPKTHQFLQAKLILGTEAHPYYILKFGASVDCIDRTKSDVSWRSIRAGTKEIRHWVKKPGVPFTLNAAAIHGLHLWQTKLAQDWKLMSDKLFDALKGANLLDGIRCEKQFVL